MNDSFDQWEEIASSTTVRLNERNRVCTGVLIAEPHSGTVHSAAGPRSTRLVLTCAHFFRTAPRRGYHVNGFSGGKKWRRRILAVRTIDGSDCALALLHHPVEVPALLGLSAARPHWGQEVTTYGFGGLGGATGRQEAQPRWGRVLLGLPVAIGRNLRTVVRPAALVRNAPPAVKGDSGGPVIADGTIVATQSLIADPFGTNLGVATVSVLAPHLPAIRAAAEALCAEPRFV
ncbi:trypsin-like peptidase domain-containing protein [Corynebacterium sp. 32222D000AT]|uniref:serine protease n=1 Tax=unclassified Corynebacterium TaxID=2624378 RepID=UPI002A9E8E3E|nr:serine protease [Mycobacteriaceae bacterium]MDY5829526.1 serine protease [Corynebacterium sp.]